MVGSLRPSYLDLPVHQAREKEVTGFAELLNLQLKIVSLVKKTSYRVDE
jgi:hypothetical protein